MGKILNFEAPKPSQPVEPVGFTSLEITLNEDGTYTLQRSGDLTAQALLRLAEVIGAMQIKIIHDAKASESFS
jgi:hypothetical protein